MKLSISPEKMSEIRHNWRTRKVLIVTTSLALIVMIFLAVTAYSSKNIMDTPALNPMTPELSTVSQVSYSSTSGGALKDSTVDAPKHGVIVSPESSISIPFSDTPVDAPVVEVPTVETPTVEAPVALAPADISAVPVEKVPTVPAENQQELDTFTAPAPVVEAPVALAPAPVVEAPTSQTVTAFSALSIKQIDGYETLFGQCPATVSMGSALTSDECFKFIVGGIATITADPVRNTNIYTWICPTDIMAINPMDGACVVTTSSNQGWS